MNCDNASGNPAPTMPSGGKVYSAWTWRRQVEQTDIPRKGRYKTKPDDAEGTNGRALPPGCAQSTDRLPLAWESACLAASCTREKRRLCCSSGRGCGAPPHRRSTGDSRAQHGTGRGLNRCASIPAAPPLHTTNWTLGKKRPSALCFSTPPRCPVAQPPALYTNEGTAAKFRRGNHIPAGPDGPADELSQGDLLRTFLQRPFTIVHDLKTKRPPKCCTLHPMVRAERAGRSFVRLEARGRTSCHDACSSPRRAPLPAPRTPCACGTGSRKHCAGWRSA